MDDGGEAIKFLLRNLHRYCTYHWNLISGAEKEFEQLQNDARLFKRFLKDTAKKRRTGNALSELARQIRDVVREADDAVDLYVLHAEQRRQSGCIVNFVQGTSNLHRVAVEVARVRSQVEEVYGGKSRLEFVVEAATSDGSDDDEPVEAAPWLRKENIVGFEEEVEELKPYIINQQTPKLIVISLTGMPGIGKTACAVMIYSEVESNFPTRIWAYVNRNPIKDVFLSVSRQLGTGIDDETTEEELARGIRTRLERGGAFFMVLDDVLKTADWDKLLTALPTENGTGKILLTSQNEWVARYASHDGSTHKLRFRTDDESRSILKRKVFGTEGVCPHELEPLVRSIAEQCGGLPVAIDAMGGILLTMCPPIERMSRWAKVAGSVTVYLRNDPEKRVEKLVDRSYRSLPDHLRDCLRYFGMFPKGFKISAWNLIQMWIAEGFVPKNDGFSLLEEAAEGCLEYLVDMNLVIADERSWDGRVKTVRVPDTIHDFCKTKSGEDEGENFLQEIKIGPDGHLEPSPENIKDVRRIAMHSNLMDLILAKLFSPRVRSFVSCSTEEETVLPKRSASAFLSAFKLLRVLEAEPIKFQRIPKGMYSLVQLRYARLSLGEVKVLSRSFSELWNIQTLQVDTTSRTLDIKADIWKMLHLTHLKTNAIATLPKPGRTIRGGAKLQTLSTISPESCRNEVFDRARNLNELGVRGDVTRILNGQNGSLMRAQKLEKLTLIHDAAPYDGPLCLLVSPTVKSLTLSGTFIDWQQMSVLGMLENLVELELKNNAFVGEKWETADGGFGNLQLLHIGETDLVTWEASAHHFPRLRRLEMSNCRRVEAVPVGFAEIPSFQVLSLYGVSRAAAISGEGIRDAAKNGGFKLIVHPPPVD